mmetsp:Transcript_28467/g.55511  ORF Transcript_28467/g.55511 Transcript_28467/m.55511 type:complete len:391 (+) Transcript_28467:130-1302(+)
MNQVFQVQGVPASPLNAPPGGTVPPPVPPNRVIVQPGVGGSPHPGYSPVAAQSGGGTQSPMHTVQPMMWGGTSSGESAGGPRMVGDVQLQEEKTRDLEGGGSMGQFKTAGIEKPITMCGCLPGFAAHERMRAAQYDQWPAVWAGHHASFLTGYPLLAFRILFNLIPQLIICIFVIVDRSWLDKEATQTGTIVTDEQFKKSQEQYLFYLSNWTNVVQFFFFVHASIVTYVAIQKYNPNDPNPVHCPWWVKIAWQTYSVTIQLSFIVMLLYWILLAAPPILAISVAQHGINVVLQLIDMFVVGHIVPLIHAVWLFIFAVCFIIFSLIHWGSGSTNWEGSNYIYGVLDWNDPAAAGTLSALVIVFLPLIFPPIFTVLSVLRQKLYTRKPIPVP